MEQNKTGKYFKYAIGEIVLVVIGILIALQINNNNEVKKERIFEVKMLHEIRNELIKDTIYFNSIKKKAKNGLKAASGMYNLLGEKNIPNDSILKYISFVSVTYEYIYHKGAYEAIKSTGIDKISNDSIRKGLTDVYDFELPRTDKFITSFTKELEKYNKVVDFINMKVTISSENKKIIVGVPKPNFLNDQVIIKSLVYVRGVNTNVISRLEKSIEKCQHLLNLLDIELKIEL